MTDQPAGTAIIPAVEANPVMVLTDRDQFNRFYDEIKRETDALEVDLTTDKGRKAIASAARRVATTKVMIDEAGKKLNEEAREKIAKVDAARREIRERLDALRDEVRRPLTEWEAAEEARQAKCAAELESLRGAGTVNIDATAASCRDRLNALHSMSLDPALFGGFLPQAEAMLSQAKDALQAAVERLDREEAERAELQRLRAEALAREEAEKAAAEAAEAERAENERREREEAERVAAEAAEAERVANAAREAEERAKRQAEEAAAAERAEAERKHNEALTAERARADALEAEQRRQREEAEREAEEQRKRDANQRHRTAVKGKVKLALMACGADEGSAVAIVKAMIAGEIPHVTVTF